jgi:hypothetical protein
VMTDAYRFMVAAWSGSARVDDTWGRTARRP